MSLEILCKQCTENRGSKQLFYSLAYNRYEDDFLGRNADDLPTGSNDGFRRKARVNRGYTGLRYAVSPQYRDVGYSGPSLISRSAYDLGTTGGSGGNYGGFSGHGGGYTSSPCCPLVVDPLTLVTLLAGIAGATFFLNTAITMNIVMTPKKKRKRRSAESARKNHSTLPTGKQFLKTWHVGMKKEKTC